MSSIISKITGALSSDIVFLLVLFILLLIYIMYFGRNKVVSLVLSFYPATLLFNSFPFISKLMILNGEKGILVNKLLIFLVFLILVNLAVKKYVALYDESATFLRKGGLALAALIIIILFSYTTVNFDLLHNFSSQIDTLFTGTERIFFWNLAPMIILFLV